MQTGHVLLLLAAFQGSPGYLRCLAITRALPTVSLLLVPLWLEGTALAPSWAQFLLNI